MKSSVILLLIFFSANAYGQNEYAAIAFYNEFNKIFSDAQAGFVANKGDKRKSEFEELSTEYKVKFLLPLADSGKIVIPFSGTPYVLYYFEPDKVRLKVDQRGANLRDAILMAYREPVYARTETLIINNYPLTNAWYFTDPNETRTSQAAFKMSIFFNMGKYYLSFEIRGKNL